MGIGQGRDVLRRIANGSAWRWPIAGRVALCVLAFFLAATVWAKRGLAVGLVALGAYALMAAAGAAGARWGQWVRRHRALDQVLGTVWVGVLIFLALAVVTNERLAYCAFQAAVSGCVFACALVWRGYRYGQPL